MWCCCALVHPRAPGHSARLNQFATPSHPASLVYIHIWVWSILLSLTRSLMRPPPQRGGFTPLSLHQVGSFPPGLLASPPPAPVLPGVSTTRSVSPPPTGDDVSPVSAQPISPPLSLPVPVDVIDDHGPSTPTMEDLRSPTAVSWTGWLRPPPTSVCRLAQSLEGGLTWPFDVTSLLGEAWVGDFVIRATVRLLAPCCRSGVNLFPPLTPGECLEGATGVGSGKPLCLPHPLFFSPFFALGIGFFFACCLTCVVGLFMIPFLGRLTVPFVRHLLMIH
jgi:hypothetical protein